MTKQKRKTQPALEGEGSYSATRRYSAGVAKSLAAGTSEALAAKAKEAVEGPEGASLREAERIGKAGHPRKP